MARRALSDCAAVGAARDAGIALSGALLGAPLAADRQPFRPGSWSPRQNVDGLYVLRSDIGRLETVVKELRPQDRYVYGFFCGGRISTSRQTHRSRLETIGWLLSTRLQM